MTPIEMQGQRPTHRFGLRIPAARRIRQRSPLRCRGPAPLRHILRRGHAEARRAERLSEGNPRQHSAIECRPALVARGGTRRGSQAWLCEYPGGELVPTQSRPASIYRTQVAVQPVQGLFDLLSMGRHVTRLVDQIERSEITIALGGFFRHTARSDPEEDPTPAPPFPYQQAHARGNVEAATVDCYNEFEQITGWLTVIDENLAMPFETTVLGVPVTVERTDLNRSEQIVAVCSRDPSRLTLPILDLPLPTPAPEGAEWIGAYRQWRGEG